MIFETYPVLKSDARQEPRLSAATPRPKVKSKNVDYKEPIGTQGLHMR